MWVYRKLRTPPKSEILVATARTRLRKAKSTLIDILVAESERLEQLLAARGNQTYGEHHLGVVLVASANYHQYLKLCLTKLHHQQLSMVEYLSPTSTKDTTFASACQRIVADISNRSQDSPILQARYTELLNLFIYLLAKLESIK